jgi:F-type H+-transporting ATPase subunit delta
VSNRLAARRYAKALVEIGEAQGNLMLLQHELGEVTALVKQSPDLGRLVMSPLVVPKRKAVVIEMVLRQAGVSVTLCNFFKVVAENARLNLIHEIEAAFRELVDQRAGVVEAKVASAQPLSEAQAKALQAALTQRTGKSIRLVASQDPALLGGVKVQVGSTVFDASLQGRLRLLKQQLLSA